jgi:hypothetical protein
MIRIIIPKKISKIIRKKNPIIKNYKNKYNDKYESIIITNEISELLEQYNFFNNLIILLSFPHIQTSPNYYSLSLQVKEALGLITINIGGINYLSKYHEKTSLLMINK